LSRKKSSKGCGSNEFLNLYMNIAALWINISGKRSIVSIAEGERALSIFEI